MTDIFKSNFNKYIFKTEMESLKNASKTKAFSKIYNSTGMVDLVFIYWKMPRKVPEENPCTLLNHNITTTS